MKISLRWAILPSLAFCFCLSGFAQSVYKVVIDTSALSGQAGTLFFDLTSNRPRTNRFDIFNFVTDGRVGLPLTSGGIISGDLIQGLNPAAFTRVEGNSFFNELALDFVQFGKQIAFTVDVTENAIPQGFPDQFALFLLDDTGQGISGLRDGLPNIAITINGQRGGELQVGRATRRPKKFLDAGTPENTDPDHNTIKIFVTPAWTTDEATGPQASFEGQLEEFCTRRCEGQPNCTAGEFGVRTAEDRFVRFDDLGNLKARVAEVESGKTSGLRARVTGHMTNEFVIRVDKIELF